MDDPSKDPKIGGLPKGGSHSVSMASNPDWRRLEEETMSYAKSPEGLPKIINKNLVRGRPLKGGIILAACLVAASSCQQASSPLEKAFEAVGGKQALLDLKSFSYEATGERFEPEEGATPTADPKKASV